MEECNLEIKNDATLSFENGKSSDLSSSELELLVSISRITFLNLAEKLNLYKKLDSARELALMSLDDMRRFSGRNLSAVSWDGRKNLEFAKREAGTILSKGIGVLKYTDASYPALLKETVNAPFLLYYKGNMDALKGPTVSMVGTRNVTQEGKKASFDFAYKAAMDNVTVVSGLAHGVDGESHKGALEAAFDIFERTGSFSSGKTVAVLPCGIDTVIPESHKALAAKIIRAEGCLVSEYAPGTPAINFRFVQRNRIIAALSPCTLVVEAPDGSGALHTANYALDYDRDLVFHKAAFSEAAEKIRLASRKRLEASNKSSSAKSLNTVEHFINLGAPVVKDYEDYKKWLCEKPGERNAVKMNKMQPELF